ncbi:MAG: TIGR02680 family protein, partial [Conexibacteraceae bacterium]|nr:TIGR02680 family protein [Conexibacteraceae bacterium]
KLRQAHTAVEAAAERLRAAADELTVERERAEQATKERDAAQTRLDTLSAEQTALVSADAWSSVAEVEALSELAKTQARASSAARGHADDAAAAAAGLAGELITAQAVAADSRDRTSDELDSLLAVASAAGLERRVTTLADQLRSGALAADGWNSLLRELATDWRDVLHRHNELMRELRLAADEAERARSREREAAGRLELAAGKRTACEQQLEEARAALCAAFEQWRSALEQLELDEPAAAAALERLHEGSSPLHALAPSVDRCRASLSDERSVHAAARVAAAAAVAATEEEIDRLAAAHDDGPAPPEWLRADRADRAGAPLWRLIDFRAEVPVHDRSSLEAGLEAAGLIDAWVTPSGAVEDPALADVVLAGAAPAEGGSLLEVFEPVPDQAVAVEVVARLLSSLGLGEHRSGPWVDIDGSFAIGPLRGRGAKDQAGHIGAAARESRRAARIAQLRERIAALESEVADRDAQIAEFDRRRRALDAELEALPPSDAVRSALDAVRVSSALELDAERGHESATAAARSAADDELAAGAARREHGAAHGLSPALDEPAVDALRDATAQLTGSCGAVLHAWTLADRDADAADAVAESLSQAQQTASEHDQRARDEETEATRLAAEHATREEALGETGVELRRRHEGVVAALRDTREELRHVSEAAQDAAVAVARLEHEQRARDDEHERARERRERASESFRQLAQAGLLQLVLRDDTPFDSDHGSSWTFSRTLEVARALPPELVAVQRTTGQLEVDVQRGVQLLDRELAEADMSAYASRDEDDLLLVHITEGGGEQTLGHILDTLETEIADREQTLTAEERRVFSDALVEEIADHLRHRIHQVRGQIERMNAVLRRSPTAAGKTVELDWEALEDEAGTQRAALARLRRDVRHLGEDDRAELVAFFRGRIESARREHTVGGEPRPMAETLMAAFDYREWFAFALHERIGSNRVRLTKRRHAVGSGGEQSVLIHLPLFAAAAALYGDSEAPRLIMLDEALSGIDDETRDRVLEATVAFDLDVVMTSHELWGTYRSVPQLAIYQLHRENGTFGVHAIPFLWDGEVLRELEQDELLV